MKKAALRSIEAGYVGSMVGVAIAIGPYYFTQWQFWAFFVPAILIYITIHNLLKGA